MKILKEIVSFNAQRVSTWPTTERVEENKLEIANLLVHSCKSFDVFLNIGNNSDLGYN